jgi:RNase H-fold protein (predicted Holliday junction resolvase)
MSEYILGIDPGREKCGYALVRSGEKESDTELISHGIVATAEIGQTAAKTVKENQDPICIAIGDGTNSKAVSDILASACPGIQINLVDEHGTSEAARRLVVARTPAKGLSKLLPIGLRSPKQAYDDVVAELIAQNFIAYKQKNL